MPLYRAPAASSDTSYGYPAQAVTGRYYRAKYVTGSAGTVAATLNNLYAKPIHLEAGTLDRIGASHFDTPTASELLRLGIYNDDNGRPGTLVLDAGTIDLSTAAAFKLITISQAITTGIYWLAGARQGPGSTATVLTYPSSNQIESVHLGAWVEHTSSWPHANAHASYYVSSVSGALPNPFGSATAYDGTGVPIVSVRYA